MKFAGKDILSTEGVKLSGAVVCSATVNGSTLWRHPDQPGAEGATYEFLVWISQVKGQRRYYASILYLPETDAKGFLFGTVSFYSQHRIFAILYSIMLWTISVCAADISFFRRINQSGTLPFLFSRVIPKSLLSFRNAFLTHSIA